MTGAPAISSQSTQVLHWPGFDGLRGIAVLAVILYHAFPRLVPLGSAGVDVFFALSGFLITALLLREYAQDKKISLRNFYMRRVLRLYPALLVGVGGTWILYAAVGGISDALAPGLVALLYLSHVWIGLGYDSGFFAHTWTLSLEENYYLIWPAILLGLLRGSRALAHSVVALTALLIVLLTLPSGVRSMFLLGSPMVVGSIASLIWYRWFRNHASSRLLGLIALCGIVALILIFTGVVPLSDTLAAGTWSVPGLIATLVIVGIVNNERSMAAKAMSLSALRWIGRRAYGLYLFHFPIVLFPVLPRAYGAFGIDAPLWLDLTADIGLTFAVAAISYRVIELPFLRMKKKFH